MQLDTINEGTDFEDGRSPYGSVVVKGKQWPDDEIRDWIRVYKEEKPGDRKAVRNRWTKFAAKLQCNYGLKKLPSQCAYMVKKLDLWSYSVFEKEIKIINFKVIILKMNYGI